jgi:hypothetical protein
MSKFIKILFSSLSIYAVVLFLGAYLTLNYEIQNPDSNIKSYYDALWWSLNATSIGDSNVYPITIQGRIVGAFLIVIGYGLFTVNVRVSTVKDVMFSVSTEPPSKLYVIWYVIASDQFALNTKFPNVPVVIT